jgi:3-dehydroquinate dehydratase type I
MKTRICVALAGLSVEEAEHAARKYDFAEIRLDTMQLGPEEAASIFAAAPGRHIATCRPVGRTDRERLDILAASARSGAAWVDVEIESGFEFIEEAGNAAREAGALLIVSHHDYEITPSREKLEEIVRACASRGPDLVKVSCLASCEADSARLMGLYELGFPLLAIGMGRAGAITRIAAVFLGAPFTFASPEDGKETAPGQFSYREMEPLLEGLSRVVG